MPEPEFALDENGFLLPPSLGDAPTPAVAPPPSTGAPGINTPAPALTPPPPPPAPGYNTPAQTLTPARGREQQPAGGLPARRGVRERPAPVPVRPAGRFNWILSALGILTAVASFVWPLLCVTVLVSLALTAVALSRANRLRRRGATGRGLAIIGLVIGLASAANLVFGFTQLMELPGQLGSHLP